MTEEEKSQIVEGTTYRYSSDWIHNLESEQHWRLYWRQQKLMEGLVLKGHSVLEIGVGSGFAANYLRSKGVEVTTIDIDEGKNPDIISNIVTYDFPDKYDHIMAFEVFEHIPFNQLEQLLRKLGQSCRQYLFMSVPRNERVVFQFMCKLPKIRKLAYDLRIKKGRINARHHFWEIGHGQISLSSLRWVLREAGFTPIEEDKFFSLCFFALRTRIDCQEK